MAFEASSGGDKLGIPSVTTSLTALSIHRLPIRILLSRLLLAFLSLATLFYIVSRSPIQGRGVTSFSRSNEIRPPSRATTPHGSAEVESESPELIWSSIDPSKASNLTFEPCYPDLYSGKLQCARLEVPLSYQNISSTTIAIALLLLPAPIPLTHPQHGGPILMNPGGPGGSGVDMLLQSGGTLQPVLNPPLSQLEKNSTPKYFDFLAFDPRGIRRSGPSVQCFSNDDDEFARTMWQVVDEAEGLLGSGFSPEGNEEVLRRKWIRSLALARGCSSSHDGHGEDPLEHVNTTPVAADMLSILDAYTASKKRHIERDSASKPQIRAQSMTQDEPAKLNFFGVSYGTVIGVLFAAMYPSRVGRFVLDGVVDSEDYFVYGGNLQTSLVDADKIFDFFLTECVQVGVEGGCAFAALANGQKITDPNSNEHTERNAAEELRRKYEEIVQRVKRDGGIGASIHPASPGDPPWPSPLDTEIITATDIEILTRNAVYQPARTFRHFAQALADLAVGNATLLAKLKHQQRRDRWDDLSSRFGSDSAPPASAITRRRRLDVRNGFDANLAILCSDTPRIYIRPDQKQSQNSGQDWEDEAQLEKNAFEDFKEYYASIKNQSRYLGDYWASVRLSCIGWKKEAQWRFNLTGLFDDASSPVASSSLISQPAPRAAGQAQLIEDDDRLSQHITSDSNSTGKILFVSQTFDPVTPYANAVKMASALSRTFNTHGSDVGSEAESAMNINTHRAIEIETAVLRQINGTGHNSFGSHSVCKAKAVRAWFQGDDVNATLGEEDDYDAEDKVDSGERKLNKKVKFRTCPIANGVFDEHFDENYDEISGKHEKTYHDDEGRELEDAVRKLYLNGFGNNGLGAL